MTFFGHDRIQWNNRITIELGLKAEKLVTSSQLHMQPRINGEFELSKKWNIHFGWGIYNQFISKNAIIGELGNRSDIWQISDEKLVFKVPYKSF